MPFTTPPPAADVGSVRYSWRGRPARGAEAGGDGLFVEAERADGRPLFLLVDVTGHGHDAAPGLAFVRDHLLADPHVWGRSPADLLQTLHGMLQPFFLETGRFVAALAVRVNGADASLAGAHAGVPRPFLAHPGQAPAPWDIEAAALLGIPAENTYEETVCVLLPGGRLLVWTDGVTEAGAPGPLFGDGPLRAFLGGLPAGLSECDMVERLFAALAGYDGDLWPRDDVTAACFGRKNDAPGG